MQETHKILFIGDIIGRPARKIVKKFLLEENNKENTPNIELQNTKKDDIQLINKGEIEEKTQNNGINVAEIQQYASYMGENLSIDDINYGLMYGRSVIADFSA